jgi:hypothetical protein
VPHENSVLHSVLTRVPWGVFDRAVAAHAADKHVRCLSTRTQFVALLYGQLSGATSLRALVSSFASHAQRLYHLGVKPVARSSLADANARRPEAAFSALFAALVALAHPKLARRMAECVLLIDSTTVRLSRLSESWARFSADLCGVKAHVVYDPEADRPVYLAVTPQRINDITAAQAMPIQPGATYVFDLGYYDYAWWAQLHDAGCRIVTRLKSNTPLTIETERLIEPGEIATASAIILSDRTGYLPARQANRRRNPMQQRVREVCVRIETGKVLRLLSNDLTAPAQEIAELYKRRWAIELFFRWVKQTLHITHLIGRSENAVRIQIAIALIAYLLLRIAQSAHGLVLSPTRFAGLVRDNLMHRKTLRQIVEPDLRPPTTQDHRQALLWAWG